MNTLLEFILATTMIAIVILTILTVIMIILKIVGFFMNIKHPYDKKTKKAIERRVEESLQNEIDSSCRDCYSIQLDYGKWIYITYNSIFSIDEIKLRNVNYLSTEVKIYDSFLARRLFKKVKKAYNKQKDSRNKKEKLRKERILSNIINGGK